MGFEDFRIEQEAPAAERLAVPETSVRPPEESIERFPKNIENNREGKRALYEWHFREEMPEEIESRLQYEQVVEGYETFVEPGRYREYEAITPYAVVHHTYDIEGIPTIVEQGALLSADERSRRGITAASGLSPEVDLKTGLSDSVFTRIITPEGLKQAKEDQSFGGEVNFIFENDVFDRLDWYAFNEDRYGGPDVNTYEGRIAPVELFERQKQKLDVTNEQVFRRGIPLQKLKYLACGSEQAVVRLIVALREHGVTHINNKLLEEAVVITPTKMDLFRASRGEPIPVPKDVHQIMVEYENRTRTDEIRRGDTGL